MKYITVTAIIGCMFLGLCLWNNTIAWDKERYTYKLNDSILQKKVLDIRDSSGRELQVYHLQTVSAQQLAMSTSAESAQLREDLKKVHGKLSKVTSSVSVHTTTRDTVSIPVRDTISIADTGSIHIPFVAIPDSFLSITGSASFTHIPGGLLFDSVGIAYSIYNRLSITHYKEHKFLHHSTLNLLVTSDNPHTTVGKVQTYTVAVNKRWYQKWYTHIGIGIISTLAVQHYIR